MRPYRVIIPERRIKARVCSLAKEIASDYRKSVYTLCVLKGATVFHADLIRKLSGIGGPKVYSGFVDAKSYQGKNAGRVRLGNLPDVRGMDVLIVEDIIDTGQTLAILKKRVLSMGAVSVRVCCLLDKPARRRAKIEPDYAGFRIADSFVVGYGMDFNEEFRELPFIAELPG